MDLIKYLVSILGYKRKKRERNKNLVCGRMNVVYCGVLKVEWLSGVR